MNVEDFKVCEFIDNNMCYFTYQEFCEKCMVIKQMYRGLTENQQLFYKWYVYANINMKETYKNAIWEYLNENDTEYYMNLLHLLTLLKRQF